jgi:hypothetical protein
MIVTVRVKLQSLKKSPPTKQLLIILSLGSFPPERVLTLAIGARLIGDWCVWRKWLVTSG